MFSLCFSQVGVAVQPVKGQEANQGDPLPEGALRRFGSVRGRHGSRILCLAFSPNGQLVLAGGGNDPLRLWDAATGRLVRTCDESWVEAVAFSPQGSVFASAGAFKTIRLWETTTGKEIAQLKGHPTGVKALALSPNGQTLASAGQDGSIRLWDMATHKEITQLAGHSAEVHALAFSPDGRLLASGGSDYTLRLWDVSGGKLIRPMNVSCAVLALVFAADGQKIWAAGDDHLVSVWETATGQAREPLKGHEVSVVSLVLSADGKTLVSGGQDGIIHLWNVATGKSLRRLSRHGGDADALALSPDGQTLASAGLNNTIRLHNLTTYKEILWGMGHKAPIVSMALSPDGQLLVASGADNRLRFWDTLAGGTIRENQTALRGEMQLAFVPDGRTVAIAGGPLVNFWDVKTANIQSQLTGPADDPVLCLALSPDGKQMVTGHRLQAVRLWERARNKLLHQWKYPGSVQTVSFAPDGKTVAAAGTHQVFLYDAATGQELRHFDSKDGPPAARPAVACLLFSPDGAQLACGCYDGQIRLFDPAVGKEIRSLEGHGSVVYALAFSPDGRTLVSGSFDQTVRCWEMCSGTLITTRKGHQGAVSSLSYAPNGRQVYSGSADTTILEWDMTGLSRGGHFPAVSLGQPELQRLWQEMASDNAGQAHAALWYLVAAPKDGLPFLHHQVFLVDPQWIKRLLKDLNDEKFKVREVASAELARCGRWIEETLKGALLDPPSEEVRRRLDKLLQRLNVPGTPSLQQERFRCRRVMLALEQMDNAEARDLLHKIAQRAPEAALREEARVTLQRLQQRRSKPLP